ncbi:acyltransferase family protein [Paenibacillus sp. 22594]|uniref:acyltransferase family protein n=1 Tax=Paenibacillus sp. 22594 TaxID=3453947 RepID=UPI003F87C1B2
MQIRWINFLKGAAMLAVVFDHLYGLVYLNTFIHSLTIYSVTLFIILAGFTSSISIGRTKLPIKSYIYKRVAPIVVPYLVATLVYHLYWNKFHFDFNTFKNQVIMFNGAAPFYFVLFFLQLIVVSPLLYKLFQGHKFYQQILGLLFIYLMSFYLTHFTNVANYYGGASRILGGSYLFCFCLGIFLQLLSTNPPSFLKRIFQSDIKGLVFGLVASLFALFVYLNTHLLDKSWANPPNKSTLVYTLIIAAILFFIFQIAEKRFKRLSLIFTPIELIGSNSLYVFLYHSLFIYYGQKIGLLTINSGKILFPIFCLVCSVLIGIITTRSKKIIKSRSVK